MPLRRLTLIFGLGLAAISAFAQPPETNDNVPNGPQRRHRGEVGDDRPGMGRPEMGNEPGDGVGFRRGGFFRDMPTSGSGAGFRSLMLIEIGHVPLLDAKLKAMLEVQQERIALQRERKDLAARQAQPSGKTLGDFHELLKREEKVTSRQQELLDGLVLDVPAIREQITQRRAEITAKIESLQAGGVEPQETSELNDFLKIQKAYDSITERLDRLKENPSQADWVRKIMRGIFSSDEFDGQMAGQALRRVQQLEQEQGDLRKRLDQLDNQISELKDLLESVGSQSPSGRMGGVGVRGRFRGGPNGGMPPGSPDGPGFPPPGSPGTPPFNGPEGANDSGNRAPPPPMNR